MLVLEKTCVIDHIRLPNLVIVAVVGFNFLLEKKKSLSTTVRKTL